MQIHYTFINHSICVLSLRYLPRHDPNQYGLTDILVNLCYNINFFFNTHMSYVLYPQLMKLGVVYWSQQTVGQTAKLIFWLNVVSQTPSTVFKSSKSDPCDV